MPFDPNTIGITSTIVQNMDAAESFLSGTSEGLESLDKEKKEPPKKEPVKPPAAAAKKEEAEGSPKDSLDPLAWDDEEEDKQEEDLKKKKVPEAEEDEEEDEKSPGSNEFQVMSKELLQLGVFTLDEGEDETSLPADAETFAQRFQGEKQKGAMAWLDAFLRKNGEDRMDLFEALFVNSVDPREYLPVYASQLDYAEVDMAQQPNQEKVYREYYKRLNWDADKIEKRLQKARDYGDLEEEAQDLQQRLVQQDQEKLQQLAETKKQQEKQRGEQEALYKGSVQKVLTEALKNKELSGIPINDQRAREVADFLSTPKYRLPNGELLTEFDKFILESKRPENIEIRAKIGLLNSLGWDFSKIERRAVSKETNALFAGLKKQAVKAKTQSTTDKGSDYWNNL